MAGEEVKQAFLDIPDALLSYYDPIAFLKLGFSAALLIYICGWPFYGSKKSYWDALAARRVVRILRTVVFFDILFMLPLLYCVIALGPPLSLNATWSLSGIGYSGSWLYDYPRPIIGIILIGFGSFADMHTIPRILCLVGALGEIVCSAVSSYQVFDYYTQVIKEGAPSPNYTRQMLYMYFIRDIVSGSLCFLLVLYTIHVATLLGWFPRQTIPFSEIAGGELDRCEVMRKQRVTKRLCEFKHELGIIRQLKEFEANAIENASTAAEEESKDNV